MQVYREVKIAKLRLVNHDGHIDRINDEIVLYEMNDTPQGTESLEEHSNENRPQIESEVSESDWPTYSNQSLPNTTEEMIRDWATSVD